MARNVDAVWHLNELMERIEQLKLDAVDKAALEVIAESDAPVDTGFLDASAYVNSQTGLNTFDQIWVDGRFVSRKTTRPQQRRAVQGPQPPPQDGAVVGWAAQYASVVEMRTHFIYTALLKVQAKHT